LAAASVVSIQISWSAGWHGQMNGRPLRVLKDGLGFMYLVPNATGPASITIDYDGGIEMVAAHWISLITLVLLALACFIPKRFQNLLPRRSNSPPIQKSPLVRPADPSELSR
jgi:hypothetical protein